MIAGEGIGRCAPRLTLGLIVVLLATVVPATAASAQQRSEPEQGDAQITVMARNLYLGADVGVALELLPDAPAAMQSMWEQVAATDFDDRVGALAAEVERYQPDVIGLQEATVWSCRPNPWDAPVPVFDFTGQFLAATAAAGQQYVVAEKDGRQALNPGYEIPAIPFLTTVRDPQTFQPLFGTDDADCGFTIGDALLVRADLADRVLAVGTSEYDARYAVAPVVFTIDRGYAWADLAVGGTTVRAVTTHLESLWDSDAVPTGAVQAGQLVDDLADTSVPLVVMGDFNADPRDPRAPDAPNPAEQPVAGQACRAQPPDVSAGTALAECNAYWTMLQAGYLSAGPDELDAANYTWGTSADLAGPDPDRVPLALVAGNPSGFTERLDYVFLANGATAVSAQVVGNDWPEGEDVWACDDPSQARTSEQAAAILAAAGADAEVGDRGVCLPTDHAGIVAVVDISSGPDGAVSQAAPPEHDSIRVGLLGWLAIILGVLVLVVGLAVWAVVRLVRR